MTTESNAERKLVGRVLRAATGQFSIGCRALQEDLPAFGALVRTEFGQRGSVYGLIFDVRVDDDPFVRQLIAAGDLTSEYVEDQRQRRQVPLEVNVLVVGGRDGDGRIYQYLPPQPPATLNWVEVCPPDEVRSFGQNLAFLRTVLNAAEAPADELLAAALRQIAAVQGSQAASEDYRVRAGRELARLLSRDPGRLDGILRRLR